MASFAELIAKELGHATTASDKLSITRTDRFDLFKVGPVLSISVSVAVVWCVGYVTLYTLHGEMRTEGGGGGWGGGG